MRANALGYGRPSAAGVLDYGFRMTNRDLWPPFWRPQNLSFSRFAGFVRGYEPRPGL